MFVFLWLCGLFSYYLGPMNMCMLQLLINLHGLAHILDFKLKSQTCASALKQFNVCFLSLSLSYSAVFCLYFGCWSLTLDGPSSEVKGGRAPSGYEAPWRGERDRGRRPRQYIDPGESRKTSERFRTQPITSAEHQATARYCSGLKSAWLRVRNAGK